MIGSLARFEKIFEHLWNDDNAKADDYYDLWQQARHDILNFGNFHIREVVENMFKHFLNNQTNHQYSYEFRFKNDQHEEKK